MKKEIEVLNPKKILTWIGAPFMSAWVLEGTILLVGFTDDLLFVNYFMEALFLSLFYLSYAEKYKCYKAEPNLKITAYFRIELVIHCLFIAGAVVQSALNVWIEINSDGVIYRHEFFFITILILAAHAVYMSIDYYATEKAALVRYCKRVKRGKSAQSNKGE